MTKRQRVGVRTATSDFTALPQIDITQWVAVDEAALSPARLKQFRNRKHAIELYLDGANEAQLLHETGLKRRNVYRIIVERCLQQHDDGTLQGWRGALPFLHIKPYTRQTPLTINGWGGGAVGALQWIFSSANGPELETRFRQQILLKGPALATDKQPRQSLFHWFIEELRKLGYEQRGEWPFNVERLGYVTVCAYIAKVLAQNPARQREILGGQDAVRKARSGDGVHRPKLPVFGRVECDAHKLDARMVVMVPSPHGGSEPRKIHRLWVIVIIEVASRVVLGYHLSLRRECSAEDVLRAVKHALTSWRPLDLQFSSNAYTDKAGFASYRSAGFLRACWDEFSVDGALANICARVEQPMHDVVGARILKPQDATTFASRRSLDDRPFIESFFRRLAEGGFHRLSPTTGSTPKDTRRNNPDVAAKDTQFQLEYASELLDTIIANYNATPHSGLGYRSPLDQLEWLVGQKTDPLRVADPGAIRRMVGVRKLCTLLGGVTSGRRPHFNLANARYSAEWLCLRTDLIGKNFWLQIEDEDDARYASVSTTQGLYLGTVRAAPPWHQAPHTLYIRQAIRTLHKRRLLHLSSHCDAIEELVHYAESSPDKKLPVHPAYLEARRVLQSHAESMAGQSMVALARNPSTSVPTSGQSTAQGLPANSPEPKPPDAIEYSIACPLPPPRTAQQW